MMSRYMPDWMSSELFIDWIDPISILRHYSKNLPARKLLLWREEEWAELVSWRGVGDGLESSVMAVAWGWRRSLVLLDRTSVIMSYLEVTPARSRPAFTSSIFSLRMAFSLALLCATSTSSIFLLISSSSILASISSIFSLNFLLKSLKRSSCTVISLPDSILAQACSSSAIFLRQLALQLCTFSVMRFMGMQLNFSTRLCFHFAQSTLLYSEFTQRRSLLAVSSPYGRSVKKAAGREGWRGASAM